MIRHLLWRASQEFDDGIVTQMLLIDLLQIDGPAQRDHALDFLLVPGQAQRKLASSRMTGHHSLRNVEVVALGDLRKKAVTADDVLERSRPSAASIANSPILQIEGRHAFRSQRGTRMPGMLKVILRAPESAMNIHHDRKRPFPFGKPEIAKLIWIGTVGQAHICGWRRLIEHVFRHARYSTTELSVTLEKKTTGGVRSL